MVAVTPGVDVVLCTRAGGGFGGSLVVPGGLASVEETGGAAVPAGASVVFDGGGAHTGGFVCGGDSIAGGADRITVGAGTDGITWAGGFCEGGADTLSGTRTGTGACRPACGGLTGVVVGPVAGSANTGEIPPVSAVSAIAVPTA